MINFGQVLPWTQIDSIKVIENERQLLNPWAGGLNTFTLKNLDFDFDGDLDLLAYEDTNQDILLWENDGESYQFKTNFYDQLVNVFVEILDINKDEIPDLITSVNRNLVWYKGRNINDTLQFSELALPFKLNQSLINADESPSFADVDNDGDFDFILNDITGQFIELYINTTLIKDSLTYQIDDACWGAFQYFYTNDSIVFNIDCKGFAKNVIKLNYQANSKPNKHIVPTLILEDLNNNGVQDLILSSGSIHYLHVLLNEGTSVNPVFNSSTNRFPANELLNIKNRPYLNKVFINNETDHSILLSPQYTNFGTEPYNISHLYQKNENQEFQLINRQFLVDEMFDVGKFSIPTFYDVDYDGLKDLFISNTIPNDSLGVSSQVYLYKNTGTIEVPQFTFVEDDFLNLSSLDDTTLDIAFGDFDKDTDDDIVVGGASGKIHYFKNEKQKFNYKGVILFKDSIFQLDFGANASPAVIDYNQDGLADILVGKSSGKLELITNLGNTENGTPVFEITNNTFGNISTQILGQLIGHSKPYFFGNLDSLNLLVGSTNGNIYQYTNINFQQSENFLPNDTIISKYTFVKPTILSITKNKHLMVAGNARGGLFLYAKKSDEILNTNTINQNDLNIKLFPNPFFDRIYIQNNQNQTGIVEFYGTNAQLLFTQKIQKGNNIHMLETQNLAAGCYLVKLKLPNYFTYQKIIKY